jgi:hypothetical protein
MFLSACLLAMLPGAGSAYSITAVAPADGGKLLFTLMRPPERTTRLPDDRKPWVYVWDLTKPELKAVVPGLPPDTTAIHPTADGKRFVLIGGPYSASHLEMWDVAEKKKLRNFEVPGRGHGLTVVSPDGGWLAFRPYAEKDEPRVWNTDTGKRAEEAEKAITGVKGMVAFSNDSKHIIAASETEYAEFDLTTGKKVAGWKHEKAKVNPLRERDGWAAVLPSGKGIVTVSATGKRRQSYVVMLRTEKKDWYLGEFWDTASAPILSPGGRWLVVTGGHSRDGGGTFALKLAADGTPELEDRAEKPRQPYGGGEGKKVPAWREWKFGEVTGGRFGSLYDSAGPIAFAPDGKHVFAAGSNGRIYAHEVGKAEQKATLYASELPKDGLPEWYILTADGAFVASPMEAEALVAKGKKKDAARVREALGVK